MAKIEIRLNLAEGRALLTSPEVMAACESYARAIQQRAGDGYEVITSEGHDRVRAAVRAATAKARRDNRENNTLLKAVKG